MKRRTRPLATSQDRRGRPARPLAAPSSDDAYYDRICEQVVSPENRPVIEGRAFLTEDGVKELTDAVIDGRIPGNPEKSKRLQAFIEKFEASNQQQPT